MILSGKSMGLDDVLSKMAPVTVAVSGGVDSLTLASAAFATLGSDAMLAVHATSPAVPAVATERVRAIAETAGWALRVIDAGEFADARYRANPVNRCFFCKTNLYGAIAPAARGQVVSGTNTDDLGEYRPGLEAARDHRVRHPFVEAGLNKAAVRALARALGLVEVADLPAAPCLSSRVETGLRIEADHLAFIHAVETRVAEMLGGVGDGRRAIRCRLRATGIVIELDAASLAVLDPADRAALTADIRARAPGGLGSALAFAPYRTGSAFLTPPAAGPQA